VQAGMGRTGKWFAYQNWGVLPDVMTLAKSLAGGVACGALVARPEVAEKLKPGTHAATFGGNPIACRAALAAIEMIEEENLLARASVLAGQFRTRFEAIKRKSPLIQEIRALGVMIGVELTIDGSPLVQRALEKGLLINCTHGSVLRLLPALTLSDAELNQGCDILEDILLRHPA
jgi:acetylornithine/N-succinyldiaminopimelate aminotransferase